MEDLILSKHALRRMKQRGIKPIVIDLLLRFGSITFDHLGAEIYCFDKKSRERIKKHLCSAELARLPSSAMNIYVVVRDMLIVTVAYRSKRFRYFQ
ncbi:DUF4258 domain-containing protein [Chitinilyticum aquatile]|uniref:DUF4258 domain-containing protein n=1 Tax=Chitinilyticum aquatile TaxID=362520 RepID=UPI000417D77D|nr:DUF4258 domain-containing protein [Chitinilyticum aquatile]